MSRALAETYARLMAESQRESEQDLGYYGSVLNGRGRKRSRIAGLLDIPPRATCADQFATQLSFLDIIDNYRTTVMRHLPGTTLYMN